MPYTLENLPDNVKKLSDKQRRQWMQVWNSAYARCTSDGKSKDTCESSAFAQANGVVLGGKSSNAASFAASVATFELAAAATPLFDDGEIVYRPGKLFEAGDYPDKSYAMTAEEIAAAVEAFADPLPLDLEHVPTPLDGKLGQLISVEARGSELHGIVALPKWLDSALEERKVSATWDRGTKTLAGLALVRNPRVSDAALMAAFAVDETLHGGAAALQALTDFVASFRHDTPEGQQLMQEIHNTTARGGATCKATNAAKMASTHEASTIQQIHDLTTDHGAACSSKRSGQSWPYMFSRREGTKMPSAWDWLKTKLEGEPAPGETATTAGMSTALLDVRESAEFKAMQQRQAALEAENARIRAERINDQAAAFADQQIREHRAFPAEREAILSDYVQRATDDALHGTVTFGEGDAKKTTSRVELLRATFAARLPHKLTAEQMKDPSVAALMNQETTESADKPKPADAERVRTLAEMTTLGRTHFAAKQNGHN
jgi:hypothetical protein